MGYHNATCGCASCGNYGQPSSSSWIHNPTCGCSACGNYGQNAAASGVGSANQSQRFVAPQAKTVPVARRRVAVNDKSLAEMLADVNDMIAALEALRSKMMALAE